jgi:hypothetical protein
VRDGAPAHAETLLQQVTGTWTLISGYEVAADGTKTVPWSAGNLILDASGHMSLFVFGKDRQMPEGPPDPRAPVGPMVAYYGTYTTDDAAKTVTFHVENASAPAFSGATRVQSITVTAETLMTKGSPVKNAAGRHHADQRVATRQIVGGGKRRRRHQ